MLSSSSAHQARWRRPTPIPKSSLPPSVSFGVAAPQLTRSLASAADNLLNVLRRLMPPDPSQSNTSLIIAESHDQSSVGHHSSELPPVNAVHESDQSVSVHQDPTPDTLLAASPGLGQVPLTSHSDQSPIPLDPLNPSAPIPQVPSPIPPPSNQRSWFSMFSWSSDKEPSVTEVRVEVASAPEALDTGAESPEVKRQPVSLEADKPADAANETADSGSRRDLQSPPTDTASGSSHSAPTSQPRSNQVNATSVREECLASLPSPSLLPHQSPVSQTQEGTSSPVVPNSAKSVFAFRFPMFAKSGSPPTAAAAPPPAEPTCEPPVGTPDTVANVAEPTPTTSIPATHVSECGNQSLNQPITATEVWTNAWWSYWRLNGSSVAEGDDRAQSQSLVARASSAAPDRSPTSGALENSRPDCEIQADVDLSSDVSTMERSAPGDEKLPSTHNADAARAPQGPTWYIPWSWYQSPSSTTIITTTPVSPDMKFGSQRGPPEHSDVKPKSGERPPIGEQEAQSAPDQVSPPQQDPSTTGSVDYSNPIQPVISSNPTRWMSLFATKAVAAKSIAYEKEERQMEVMEIDDEVVPPDPNSASSTTLPSTNPSLVQVTKPIQLHTSDNLPPSSPPPVKSDDKRSPILHAATHSETVVNNTLKRQPSPSPSKKSGVKTPPPPPLPNLILPTWSDTFHTLPRSAVPHEPPSALSKTLQFVSDVLFPRNETTVNKGKGKANEIIYSPYDRALPRTWDVLGAGGEDVLRGCKRVVIIGVHGWFPGTVLRTLAGEPTGTSSKFVSGLADALDLFLEEHKVKLDKVTKIPLEGEGTISRRVERLYQNLIGNKEWMEDLHDADAIFVATHSQGSVVSTHLLDRLIADRHIHTTLNIDASVPASGVASGSVASVRLPQRICCLALCGIHLGPLRYLSTSSLVQPYIQYFESTAARELFEFQNTESTISRSYMRALRNVLNNGIKMVYVASLNDQVVGLYSGLFTSVSHPLILRALYIDGDAYHPSDFLTNLLVLLLRIRNAGLSDGELLTHLSEATAGSLNGIGHSTPYEERATYSLAINYLFLTDSGSGTQAELVEEPFNALAERNDYEIPWALRELIADERVVALFSDQIVALRNAFRDWHPKTAILRDVKRKLQPIQRLSSTLLPSHNSRL